MVHYEIDIVFGCNNAVFNSATFINPSSQVLKVYAPARVDFRALGDCI